MIGEREKMRIAFFTPEFMTEKGFDGGLSNYLDKLTAGLVQSGHQVTIYVLSENNRRWNRKQVKIVGVKQPRWLLEWCDRWPLSRLGVGLNNLVKAWVLTRVFERDHGQKMYDLLQVPSYCSLGILVARKKTLPMVTRLSSLAWIYRGVKKFPSFGDVINDYLQMKMLMYSNLVISPSSYLAEKTADILPLSVKVVRTPIDPIDEKKWDVSMVEKIKNKKYILFCGSLSRVKGAGMLIETADALLGLDRGLNLMLVGKDLLDEGGVVSRINRYVKNTSRVTWWLPLRHSRLFPLMQKAEALVVPSRADNFPNVVIEAMSVGGLVIASKGKGADELIIHRENGVVMSELSSDALIQAVRLVMTMSKQEKRALRQKAKETVKAHLSLDKIVGEHVRAYREAIERYEQIKQYA